jgi:hypothetical protein
LTAIGKWLTPCINYKEFETKKIRHSFTCQFHPELLLDLCAIGNREASSYSNSSIEPPGIVQVIYKRKREEEALKRQLEEVLI